MEAWCRFERHDGRRCRQWLLCVNCSIFAYQTPRVNCLQNSIHASDCCRAYYSGRQLLSHSTMDRNEGMISFFLRWILYSSLKVNYHYPVWAKWAFAHVPFLMYAYRCYMMITVHFRDFSFYRKLTLSISGWSFMEHFLGEFISQYAFQEGNI
jgi:hypothetical protein